MKIGDKVNLINTQWCYFGEGIIINETEELWEVGEIISDTLGEKYNDKNQLFYKSNNLQKGFSKIESHNDEPTRIELPHPSK